MTKLTPALHELREIATTLGEDAQETAKSSLKGGDRERRHFVRAVFAHLEGVVYRLKQLAYWASKEFGTSLTPGESAMLLEEDYDLNASGAVVSRNARIPFLSNVRFTFAALSKACEIAYVLPVNGQGWENLRVALKVRDRLMHPKTAADLHVTDAERDASKQAYEYIRTELVTCLRLLQTKMGSDE